MALRVAGSSPVIHPRLPPLCGGKRRKPQSEPLRLPAFCPFRAAAAFFFGRPAERRGDFFILGLSRKYVLASCPAVCGAETAALSGAPGEPFRERPNRPDRRGNQTNECIRQISGCGAAGSARHLRAKDRVRFSLQKARNYEKIGGKTCICRLACPRTSGLTYKFDRFCEHYNFISFYTVEV